MPRQQIIDGAAPVLLLVVLAAPAALNMLDGVKKLLLKRDSAFLYQEKALFMPGANARTEAAAKTACASGGRAAILRAVDDLEAVCVADDFLDNEAERLDGRWRLLATVAGRKPGDDLENMGRANVVNASGLVLDTSETLPIQAFDVARSRVANEIGFDAFGGCTVRVSGGFRRGANGRRADVLFDNLEVFSSGDKRLFSAGWVFSLINAVKPDLRGEGRRVARDVPVADDARGRGNKGIGVRLEKTDERAPWTRRRSSRLCEFGDRPLDSFPE